MEECLVKNNKESIYELENRIRKAKIHMLVEHKLYGKLLMHIKTVFSDKQKVIAVIRNGEVIPVKDKVEEEKPVEEAKPVKAETPKTSKKGKKGKKGKGKKEVADGKTTNVIGVKADGNITITGGTLTIVNTCPGGKYLSADGNITIGPAAKVIY